MDLQELKARLQRNVVVTSPSACGVVPPQEDDDDDEAEEIIEDDLLYALNLLHEVEDAMSSIFKLDKRHNFLSMNHYKDLRTLSQNITDFTEQFEEDPS
jgi:hypothetical protein